MVSPSPHVSHLLVEEGEKRLDIHLLIGGLRVVSLSPQASELTKGETRTCDLIVDDRPDRGVIDC